MSTATVGKRLMTLEEFQALPDDGVERWLIRGELWEKRDTDMTRRNRHHSVTEGRVTYLLCRWLGTQPEPRGEVVCGEAGFILRRNPDSAVGVDVAYIDAGMAAATPPDTAFFDGPPVLAVEILSPNDTQREITAKVRDYLSAGVRAIWVIDPDFRTVDVHKPGANPASFNVSQILTADPELPGFSAAVADFFR
ncbi:MAG TPA: Uma2 family endonuclease [Fimbriiglobus sp.]|nr:Uma2 family endonuclease [Fimbriiglobus sp.]